MQSLTATEDSLHGLLLRHTAVHKVGANSKQLDATLRERKRERGEGREKGEKELKV